MTAQNRRSFNQQLAAASMVSMSGVPPLFLTQALADQKSSKADRTKQPILVMVQMGGGNDGLNTVVPYQHDTYLKARPALKVGSLAALKISGSDLGLHPQLAELHRLYNQGLVGIVQGVGYPNPDRSHFRSMDIWHSANPAGKRFDEGWLGKALKQQLASNTGSQAMPAISLGTEKFPLMLNTSGLPIPNIQNANEYRLDLGVSGSAKTEQAERVRKLSQVANAKVATPAAKDLEFLRSTTTLALDSSTRLEALAGNSTGNYPNSRLAQQLKTVSQMIQAEFGPRVYFLTHDGFDTHAKQDKAHAALLAELSQGINAFVSDLKSHKLLDQVCLVTFSEFGRRLQENASLGTDHGAASVMFTVGTRIKSGLVGKYPSLTDLDEGDLKYNHDFRDVYASLLDDWLGIDSKPILGTGTDWKRPGGKHCSLFKQA